MLFVKTTNFFQFFLHLIGHEVKVKIAEKIKADRIIALQDRGIKNWDKIKLSSMSLIDFLKQYEQDSFGFKPSTLRGARICGREWSSMSVKRSWSTSA